LHCATCMYCVFSTVKCVYEMKTKVRDPARITFTVIICEKIEWSTLPISYLFTWPVNINRGISFIMG
jgi:hypothetical protein